MRYFTISEIKCSHCGEVLLDIDFMTLMDALRERVGEPLNINSWYRCEDYDAEWGGKGNHTSGRAADIYCESSRLRDKILVEARQLGVRRFGIGKDYVHIDICREKPQGVTWVY
jgi:hypothetical protein